jgi:hypothetical protein
VVRLDVAVTGSEITRDIAVLELRYLDQTWHKPGPVHIEFAILCRMTGHGKNDNGENGLKQQ